MANGVDNEDMRLRPRPARVTRASILGVGTFVRDVLGGRFEADAEYGVLEELEEEDELAFGFASEDAAKAFDAEGVLHGRLPLFCADPGRGELQVAFARFGVAASIPLDEDAEEDAFVGPDAATRESDLVTMLAWFDALRAAGIEAEPNLGVSRTDGFSELTSAPDESAIFWHEQSHDAFDATGKLVRPLHLHWRGDRDAIAGVLRAVAMGRLTVDVPADTSSTFIVRPAAEKKEEGDGGGNRKKTRRFEFSEGTSNKFWEIHVEGAAVITRYGKIGTTGQEKHKAFDSVALSEKAYEKLVAEKTKKDTSHGEERGLQPDRSSRRRRLRPILRAKERLSARRSASLGVNP